MGFVEIAREIGISDEVFLFFLEKKLGDRPVKEWYSTTDVFVSMLGRHRRTFQAWERQSGFPVRNPPRGKQRIRGRAYTPEQVVKILWWWWNHRAVENRGKKGGD